MGESTTLYVVYLTGPFGFFLAHKSKQKKKNNYMYIHAHSILGQLSCCAGWRIRDRLPTNISIQQQSCIQSFGGTERKLSIKLIVSHTVVNDAIGHE